DFYQFNASHLLTILLSAFIFNSIYAIFMYKEYLIENLSITVFGIIYQMSIATLILIRQQTVLINQTDQFGSGLVMLLFLTIWICDTAAYLWGSKFGRHKLFVRISPKKTWEGAIAGFITALMFAYLLKFILVPSLSFRQSLFAGFVIGIVGQIGDLVESGFKRQAGVKDSSSFLPGHGGILDRFDSPLFVAPCIYIGYWILGI
ncbi:phosphatidate cytidylyltransferase, partial [bacterium]|nr:phosphatidate cytidylyltransferase [candidate division CSSED10-310 bacterium]